MPEESLSSHSYAVNGLQSLKTAKPSLSPKPKLSKIKKSCETEAAKDFTPEELSKILSQMTNDEPMNIKPLSILLPILVSTKIPASSPEHSPPTKKSSHTPKQPSPTKQPISQPNKPQPSPHQQSSSSMCTAELFDEMSDDEEVNTVRGNTTVEGRDEVHDENEEKFDELRGSDEVF